MEERLTIAAQQRSLPTFARLSARRRFIFPWTSTFSIRRLPPAPTPPKRADGAAGRRSPFFAALEVSGWSVQTSSRWLPPTTTPRSPPSQRRTSLTRYCACSVWRRGAFDLALGVRAELLP